MIRFIAYVRKSQDRSDRQVMSIEGQINEIKRFAKQNGYVIVDIVIEKQSAKKPGRPLFNKMIERIQKGEANGILCWKLNRLARNPVDAGTISWMLQGNVIQAIHSKERSYLPSDNVLMMQIDFGIANQFIKDLSSDVKRGMRDKARDGWCPQSRLPIGYLHNPKRKKSQKQIVCDTNRFKIVKRLWELMETGAYSVHDIKQEADRMKLINFKGKPFALSTFYTMFKNPFYYGKFYWKDENDKVALWDGKHTAMISEATFTRVQRIITRRSQNSRPQGYSFTYRGLITCGECDGHVSAERKLQVTCENCRNKYSIRTNETCPKCNMRLSEMKGVNIIDITYYRCTRKKDRSCRQKAITETKIEELICTQLKQVSIQEDVYNWLKQRLPNYLEKLVQDSPNQIASLERKVIRIKQKLKNLMEMRISGEIDKEQAQVFSQEYQKKIDDTEQELLERKHSKEISQKENLDYLEFSKNCIEAFKNGEQKTKKKIVMFFGSNFKLIDKTLYFSTKKAPKVLSLMQNTLFSNLARSNSVFPSNNKELQGDLTTVIV